MSKPVNHFYEFGRFRLDAVKRVLLREGKPVAVTPKAFDTLLALIESRERVIEKDELLERLWPDTVVEEHNLTVNISALRKALGESPDQRQYIVTIPGRGYRFVADVRLVEPENEQAAFMLAAEGEAELIVQKSAKVSIVEEEEEMGGQRDGGMERQSEGAIKSFSPSLHPSVSPSLSPSVPRSAFAAVALLAVLMAGAAYWWKTKQQAAEQASNSDAVKSLAVLPFKALTPQAGQEYLGVGMADVMITRLSNLRQLVVRPTSSVLPFGSQDSLQAGQILKVDSVLDGSIQQVGDRVRVTVRLVRISDGQQLWADQYDEQGTDVFKLQDTVSARVTEALALKLTSDEQRRLTKRYTENAAAYQEYFKGRFYSLQFTPEGFQNAVEHLNAAIRLDPTYALAYAGLADAYMTASERFLSPREALAKGRAAAEKAVALDEVLAEAHAALGHVMLHQADPGSEREFKRAMELNPNSAAVLLFYGEYFIGRDAAKGVAVLRRVQQLDPLSPMPGMLITGLYFIARQPDEALREAQKVVELDPHNPISRFYLAVNRGATSSPAQVIAELEELKPQLPTPELLVALGYFYALAGRHDKARKMIAELNQLATEQYVSPFGLALIYTGLGDKDQAFAYLERAREDQSDWVHALKVDPRMDSLRSDPRFNDLVRRAKLEP